MPRIPIHAIDDPRLSPYRNLPHKGALRCDGGFITEGRLLVERLLASRFETQSILVDEQHADEFAARAGEQVPLYVASRRLLEDVIGFNFHRGVLACGRRGPEVTLHGALECNAASELLTIVVCADVRDPENVGAILRNSAAFGVDAVIVSRRSADPFSRRVLRVSMGAPLLLPIVATDDVAASLRELHDRWRVTPAATVLDGAALTPAEFVRPPRLALVFGSEGYGVPPDVLAACPHRLTIPMRPGTDSLNVAVASGIFLYELTR
jgi:tRNA G18 (ribose-2'-O)-methylase SpoU